MNLIRLTLITGGLLMLSRLFGKDRHEQEDLINWADLTGGPLDLILSKLFGKDRLSFRLVCKSWNALTANSPYRYSPCLLNYYQRTHTWKFYQYNNFFNMTFPMLENTMLCYSKYGWLLMSENDHGKLFFFDPSNNQKIDLQCKPPFVYTSLCFFSPPTSPECVVVGVITTIGGIEVGTHKCGEDKWQTTEYHNSDPGSGPFLVSKGPPVLHCGLIFILSTKGDVAILDIVQQRFDFNFKCLSLGIESDLVIREQHLVKVNGEDSLFGVFVFADEKKVQVFRLSSDLKWDLVEGIGDKVLYLSHFSSFGDKPITKSMENCIYFPMFHSDVAVYYSLRDTKYHYIDGDYFEGNVGGLKRLDLAAWIMPIPAHEVKTSLSWL